MATGPAAEREKDRRVNLALFVLLAWYAGFAGLAFLVFLTLRPEAGVVVLVGPIIAVGAGITGIVLAVLAQSNVRLGAVGLGTVCALIGIGIVAFAAAVALAIRAVTAP